MPVSTGITMIINFEQLLREHQESPSTEEKIYSASNPQALVEL